MAKNRQGGPHGLLVVDKPVGWTSHDVVARARSLLAQRRIGHSGTLDPPATGLLLLGVGQMTRAMRYFTVLPKTYVGQLVLGTTTSTLDDTGEVTGTFTMDGIELTEVAEVAKKFVGKINQIPPMVSAIKIDGKRLHELAREGIEIERKPRPVTIHSLSVGDFDEPGVFELTVTCSSGTYIRTLADDLARALGGGGHLRSLRRTQIGSFSLTEAVELPARDKELQVPLNLLDPVAALRDYQSLVIDAQLESLVKNGVVLRAEQLQNPIGELLVLVSEQGALLAMYEQSSGSWKPAFVIPS